MKARQACAGAARREHLGRRALAGAGAGAEGGARARARASVARARRRRRRGRAAGRRPGVLCCAAVPPRPLPGGGAVDEVVALQHARQAQALGLPAVQGAGHPRRAQRPAALWRKVGLEGQAQMRRWGLPARTGQVGVGGWGGGGGGRRHPGAGTGATRRGHRGWSAPQAGVGGRHEAIAPRTSAPAAPGCAASSDPRRGPGRAPPPLLLLLLLLGLAPARRCGDARCSLGQGRRSQGGTLREDREGRALAVRVALQLAGSAQQQPGTKPHHRPVRSLGRGRRWALPPARSLPPTQARPRPQASRAPPAGHPPRPRSAYGPGCSSVAPRRGRGSAQQVPPSAGRRPAMPASALAAAPAGRGLLLPPPTPGAPPA
jgi:hypothetical protein